MAVVKSSSFQDPNHITGVSDYVTTLLDKMSETKTPSINNYTPAELFPSTQSDQEETDYAQQFNQLQNPAPDTTNADYLPAREHGINVGYTQTSIGSFPQYVGSSLFPFAVADKRQKALQDAARDSIKSAGDLYSVSKDFKIPPQYAGQQQEAVFNTIENYRRQAVKKYGMAGYDILKNGVGELGSSFQRTINNLKFGGEELSQVQSFQDELQKKQIEDPLNHVISSQTQKAMDDFNSGAYEFFKNGDTDVNLADQYAKLRISSSIDNILNERLQKVVADEAPTKITYANGQAKYLQVKQMSDDRAKSIATDIIGEHPEVASTYSVNQLASRIKDIYGKQSDLHLQNLPTSDGSEKEASTLDRYNFIKAAVQGDEASMAKLQQALINQPYKKGIITGMHIEPVGTLTQGEGTKMIKSQYPVAAIEYSVVQSVADSYGNYHDETVQQQDQVPLTSSNGYGVELFNKQLNTSREGTKEFVEPENINKLLMNDPDFGADPHGAIPEGAIARDTGLRAIFKNGKWVYTKDSDPKMFEKGQGVGSTESADYYANHYYLPNGDEYLDGKLVNDSKTQLPANPKLNDTFQFADGLGKWNGTKWVPAK